MSSNNINNNDEKNNNIKEQTEELNINKKSSIDNTKTTENSEKNTKVVIEKKDNKDYNNMADHIKKEKLIEKDFPKAYNGDGTHIHTVYAALAVVAALFVLVVIIDQSKLRSGGYRSIDSAANTEPATEVAVQESTVQPQTSVIKDDENVSGQAATVLKYTDVSKMTNDEIADIFFEETVFIGDFITSDLEKYSSKENSAAFLKKIQFLTADELTTFNAINSPEEPVMYKGKMTSLCDAVSDIKPVRIFVNLGTNELTDEESVDETIYNYCQLVYNLKKASSSSKIYVISVPPVTKAREKEGYENSSVLAYNEKMNEFAGAWGAVYVDIASTLKNGQGYLPDSYTSDGIRITDNVYKNWEKFFRTYAAEHINDGLKKN